MQKEINLFIPCKDKVRNYIVEDDAKSTMPHNYTDKKEITPVKNILKDKKQLHFAIKNSIVDGTRASNVKYDSSSGKLYIVKPSKADFDKELELIKKTYFGIKCNKLDTYTNGLISDSYLDEKKRVEVSLDDMLYDSDRKAYHYYTINESCLNAIKEFLLTGKSNETFHLRDVETTNNGKKFDDCQYKLSKKELVKDGIPFTLVYLTTDNDENSLLTEIRNIPFLLVNTQTQKVIPLKNARNDCDINSIFKFTDRPKLPNALNFYEALEKNMLEKIKNCTAPLDFPVEQYKEVQKYRKAFEGMAELENYFEEEKNTIKSFIQIINGTFEFPNKLRKKYDDFLNEKQFVNNIYCASKLNSYARDCFSICAKPIHEKTLEKLIKFQTEERALYNVNIAINFKDEEGNKISFKTNGTEIYQDTKLACPNLLDFDRVFQCSSGYSGGYLVDFHSGRRKLPSSSSEKLAKMRVCDIISIRVEDEIIYKKDKDAIDNRQWIELQEGMIL